MRAVPQSCCAVHAVQVIESGSLKQVQATWGRIVVELRTALKATVESRETARGLSLIQQSSLRAPLSVGVLGRGGRMLETGLARSPRLDIFPFWFTQWGGGRLPQE